MHWFLYLSNCSYHGHNNRSRTNYVCFKASAWSKTSYNHKMLPDIFFDNLVNFFIEKNVSYLVAFYHVVVWLCFFHSIFSSILALKHTAPIKKFQKISRVTKAFFLTRKTIIWQEQGSTFQNPNAHFSVISELKSPLLPR